jgi:hypothetical protein
MRCLQRVDRGLTASAIGAKFSREWRLGARSKVNHTQRRGHSQLIDSASRADRLTWVRFPSPAPVALLFRCVREDGRARHGAVGRARLASLKCPFAPADSMLKSLVGKAAFRPDGTLT